jgi:alkylation response protein AidB-like acyl-CoA dehydrogenase
MIVVDMKTPGLKVDPMHLLSQHDINTVFLEDVRAPAANLVGELNGGWTLITNQLNHERVTLCAPGMLEGAYNDVVSWAKETKLSSGKRVIDQEWVQVNLAKVRTGLEFLKLINWKVAWTGTKGSLDVADASSIKVFGTEFYLDAFRHLMEIIGPRAYLTSESPDAVASGRLEMLYRSLIILTFGGGTNEIQRDLIAMFGLGLPRALRG